MVAEFPVLSLQGPPAAPDTAYGSGCSGRWTVSCWGAGPGHLERGLQACGVPAGSS